MRTGSAGMARLHVLPQLAHSRLNLSQRNGKIHENRGARLFLHDGDLLGVVDLDARDAVNFLDGTLGGNRLVLEMRSRVGDAGAIEAGGAGLGDDDRETL